MRDKYIKFISELSKNLHPIFGNIWWYSLIHEKNVIKTKSYHWIAKNLDKKVRFVTPKSFYLAVRKYFSFVVRYFLFRIVYSNDKSVHFRAERLVVMCHGNYLDSLKDMPDTTWVILPQRDGWKETIKDRSKLLLDEFLSVRDFFWVVWKYFCTLITFYNCIFVVKDRCKVSAWKNDIEQEGIYRKLKFDFWRSFAGDILIEGLFYERMFKRLAENFPKLDRIVYVHEGHAWEKALCIAFKDTKKVALLCSASCKNILNYYYHKDEVKIMPAPDSIGVPGAIAYLTLREYYGDRAFIYGTARYNDLKEIIENPPIRDKKHDVLFLSADREIAEAMVKAVCDKATHFKCIRVSFHPDCRIETPWSEIKASLDFTLRQTNRAITFDSSIVVETFAYGIPTIVPDLKEYVSMTPMDDLPFRVEYYNGWRIYNPDKEECREFAKSYYTFLPNGEVMKRIMEE